MLGAMGHRGWFGHLDEGVNDVLSPEVLIVPDQSRDHGPLLAAQQFLVDARLVFAHPLAPNCVFLVARDLFLELRLEQ